MKILLVVLALAIIAISVPLYRYYVVRGFPGDIVAIQGNRDRDDREGEHHQQDFHGRFSAPHGGSVGTHSCAARLRIVELYRFQGFFRYVCHGYLALRYCSADCSAMPTACAREIFARL